MTVSSSQSRIQHAGDGVTDSFAFPYRLLAASHLKVYADDTLLTLTTDYTVSIASGGGSATVTTTVPVANGVVLTLDRVVPLTQETDYPEGDPFPAQSHEDALDKLTLIVQQHDRRLQDVPRIPVTDPSGAALLLPNAEPLAVWSWNDDATAVVYRQVGSVEIAEPADLSVTTGKLASLSVTTEKVAEGAVTFAKMQPIATDKLLGRATAGTGDVEEVTCTAAGRALLDDVDAAAQRTTLQLGTMATQSSGAVSISGGNIVGQVVAQATATDRGSIELATAAEVRAANDTERAVVPATVKSSPHVAALVFSFEGRSTNGACTMIGGTIGGTVSVERINAARYEVTLPTMSNATYRVLAGVSFASDIVGMCTQVYEKTTGGFKIRVVDGTNGSADSNTPVVDIAIFGVLA